MGTVRTDGGAADEGVIARARDPLEAGGYATPLYNLACCEALAGHGQDAIGHLRVAFERQPSLRDFARDDTDLDRSGTTRRFARCFKVGDRRRDQGIAVARANLQGEDDEHVSTTPPASPPPPRPQHAAASASHDEHRSALWRGLFFLVALILILITVWHVADQVTKRRAEESFAGGQIRLEIAKIHTRAGLAAARDRLAAAQASRDTAILVAGIGSAHALAGSGSKRLDAILTAITAAISRDLAPVQSP